MTDAHSRAISTNPNVEATWLCRFPRGHNAIEIKSARKGQTITLYITKTGLIRVYKGGKELK